MEGIAKHGLRPLSGHGPSTLVLAFALGATGCLCRLCLVCAYDAPVAVTAAVSAINCTAVIAEPVFLVSALAIPPPPADAAHKGMHGIPMQRLAQLFSQVMTCKGAGTAGPPSPDAGAGGSGVRPARRFLVDSGGGGGVRPRTRSNCSRRNVRSCL